MNLRGRIGVPPVLHWLVAKQFLRIAIAPAKAGTTCRNVRLMGAMRKILVRRNLSLTLAPFDGARVRERGDIHLATWKRSRCRNLKVPDGSKLFGTFDSSHYSARETTGSRTDVKPGVQERSPEVAVQTQGRKQSSDLPAPSSPGAGDGEITSGCC